MSTGDIIGVCHDRQHNVNTLAGKLMVPVSLIDTGIEAGTFSHFSESEATK